MSVPLIAANDIHQLIGECNIIGTPRDGGQKRVYQCEIDGANFALKFIKIDGLMEARNEIKVRAEREVEALRICDSPNLIKIGPIGLTSKIYNTEHLLWYSEDWIDGQNISEMLSSNGGRLDSVTVIHIGLDTSYAIEELWRNHKVHRDIKPNNIMYSNASGRYILLDLGIVFDSNKDTLTAYQHFPGTNGYYSPEQINWTRRYDLDFRSDLFCLGIVMYECLTGVHPFRRVPGNMFEIISMFNPPPPHLINHTIPIELSNIIMRLLKKRPSERYRNCTLFRNDLNQI